MAVLTLLNKVAITIYKCINITLYNLNLQIVIYQIYQIKKKFFKEKDKAKEKKIKRDERGSRRAMFYLKSSYGRI